MHSAATAIVTYLFFLSFRGTTPLPLPNCTQTFSCGPLQNLTYPFSGGSRPSYCGLPELHLTCQNGTVLLTSGALTYIVHEVSQSTHTMSISRQDLSATTCTHHFLNTTVDGAALSLTTHNENLTLFYGCNSSLNDTSSSRVPNLFFCDVDGTGVASDSFYLIGPVPTDPVLYVVRCNYMIQVPMHSSQVDQLMANRSLLGEVLRDGFEVSYGEDECDGCRRRFGGECGFDPDERRMVCICGDRFCPGKKSSRVSLGIGIAIGGAAIFGVFLGGCLMLRRQRKRDAGAENQSKELLSAPPINKNKNVHTPPADLSLSIPSYPYSNSYPKSEPEKGSSYFGVQVFSYTELEEATDNFDPSKELGSGGFGTVYYGILRDGRAVAVKRLFDNNMKRAEQFMNEIKILAQLRHRNLVTLYGCTSRRTRELIMVYEYIPNGTVDDHLHGDQSKARFLPWSVRLSIAIETADALAYLHSFDVIHRDVKTNNILLDNDFRVKVADFGLSRLFPNNVTHVSTAPQGTPGYVDPEYYHTYQLTNKSDVYSFGVVLIELISSLPAVDTSRHRQDVNLANMATSKIQNGSTVELIDPRLGFEKDNSVRKMATSFAELAFRCLQQERDMRPTMNEVYQALKKIQDENCPAKKCEETLVEIKEDDAIPLKQVASPSLSPDSTEQWISSSTVSSS